MHRFITMLIAAVTIITSCSKQNNTPTTPLNQMIHDSAITVAKGNFNNGPYGSVSGMARIYKDSANHYQLKLVNLSSSNGPNLKVLLSKEMQPVNFIDLGSLQSTSGNQVYNISGSPDLTVYKYALVHCVDYNHLFGWAELAP